MNLENKLEITLAVLLFSCLLPLPYGYFQFVRFAAMIGFSYLAYCTSQQKSKNGLFIYIGLALLFQPFIKIALGRTIWNLVDVAVSIGLLLSIACKKKRSSH